MADPEHLEILNRGVETWNGWRKAHPGGQPNLRSADLEGRDLSGVNFNDVNLRRSKLNGATLDGASFRRADLRRATLVGASLRGADLSLATLVDIDMEGAILDDCRVYGISAWNVNLEQATQRRLIVTRATKPELAVDDLEVAQFVHLLIQNRKISRVISTVARRAVLILGRFSPPERTAVLDAVADELRALGYLPMLFDFEGARERDFTETIKILAGLSLFVIADITEPRSSPLELQATIPDFKIPFVAVLEEGQTPFAMYHGLLSYNWVLQPVRNYRTKEELVAALEEAVVKPAIERHAELVRQKAQEVAVQNVAEIARQSRPSGSEDRVA